MKGDHGLRCRQEGNPTSSLHEPQVCSTIKQILKMKKDSWSIVVVRQTHHNDMNSWCVFMTKQLFWRIWQYWTVITYDYNYRTVLLTWVLQQSSVCKKLLEIAHYLGAIHSWITSERCIVYTGGSECTSEESLLTFRILRWPITNIRRTRFITY